MLPTLMHLSFHMAARLLYEGVLHYMYSNYYLLHIDTAHYTYITVKKEGGTIMPVTSRYVALKVFHYIVLREAFFGSTHVLLIPIIIQKNKILGYRKQSSF